MPGKVKMLGIGSAKRLPQVADIPTIAEAGNLPGYLAGTWFGLAVTGGTPQPVVDRINKDVRDVMAEPAFKEKFMARQLYEPMDSSPAEFRAFIQRTNVDVALSDIRAFARGELETLQRQLTTAAANQGDRATRCTIHAPPMVTTQAGFPETSSCTDSVELLNSPANTRAVPSIM